LAFTAEGGSVTVAVTATDSWSATGGAEWSTLSATSGEGDASRFGRAVTQAIESCSGGMMLFDLCHIVSHDWWDTLKAAIERAE